MGKSNPNGRGFASAHNPQITNQFTAGGTAKAGLGRHIGMGWFVREAIVNGASGHAAPPFSGLSWPTAFAQGKVREPWPVPNINQLSGVGMPRWGMTRAPADGVNVAALDAGRARVRAGPPMWGLRLT